MTTITDDEARNMLDQYINEVVSLEVACVLDPDVEDDVSEWLEAMPLVRHIFLRTCLQWSRYPSAESDWVGTRVTVGDPGITLTRLVSDDDVDLTVAIEGFSLRQRMAAPVLAGLLDRLD